MGVHGFIVLLYVGVLFFIVGQEISAPEPPISRLNSYYDDPTKVGIILALFWAVVGMLVGVWVAALLAWPDLRFDAAWSGFGRLRPVHTSGVIFGFGGGNALIATSFHVMQRTSRARLPGALSPWFVLLGFNLFCIIAASGYLMGVTQSKEYAEPEWYADIWLVIVWVIYFVLYIRTLARRNEPHIYVANWYYLSFVLVVAILHIFDNLAVPASFTAAKSYSAFSGVQDAMTQMVVRAQRRGLLPDHGLSGDALLFHAEADPAADLFLSPVDPQLGALCSSTSGSDRTICTTPPCQSGCRRLA